MHGYYSSMVLGGAGEQEYAPGFARSTFFKISRIAHLIETKKPTLR